MVEKEREDDVEIDRESKLERYRDSPTSGLEKQRDIEELQ